MVGVFSLSIGGEPYLCKRVDKRTFLYMDIAHTKYTLLDAGEYVVIDRHFNCFFMTAAQMEALISRDFKNFKIPLTNIKRVKVNKDE